MRLLFLALLLSIAPLYGQETHIYVERKTGDLSLDIHLPKNSVGPTPTILWIHGGGWQNGSKANWKLVEWLTTEGYAVVSIDYRLTDIAPFPAQIEDCHAALAWIQENGEKHHLDTDRIIVSGLSAGAHLASLLATTSPGLIGAIHFYGPSDLTQMARYAKEDDAPLNQPDSNVYKLLDGPLRDRPELAKEASPVTHLDASDPPLLVFVGTEDSLMTQRQCQRLHDAALEAQVRSEFHEIAGAGHGGKPFSDPTRRNLILAFLSEL